MTKHPELPHNGFAICHICGTHAEKEENEISRHYNSMHGQTHPQYMTSRGGRVPYASIRIVPQAVAIDLAGLARITALNNRGSYTNVNNTPKTSFATRAEIAALYGLAGRQVPAWVATIAWPPAAGAPVFVAPQPAVPVVQANPAPPPPPAPPPAAVPVQQQNPAPQPQQAPVIPPPPAPPANPVNVMPPPPPPAGGMFGLVPGHVQGAASQTNHPATNPPPATTSDANDPASDSDYEDDGPMDVDEDDEPDNGDDNDATAAEQEHEDFGDDDTISDTSDTLPALNRISGSIGGHEEPVRSRWMRNYTCHIHKRENLDEELTEGPLRAMFDHYNQWHPLTLREAFNNSYNSLYEEEARTRRASGREVAANDQDDNSSRCYVCRRGFSDFDALDLHFRQRHEAERWAVVEGILDRWSTLEGTQYPKWLARPAAAAPAGETPATQSDQPVVAQNEVEEAADTAMVDVVEDAESEESEEE